MALRSKKSTRVRSPLRLEILEARQLLATIVDGSGLQIASNVSLNGGVYDQILMTGPSLTVIADPGEVVRVSYLDADGDIVQAEFAGKGSMTLLLENFKTAGSVGYINKNPSQTLNGKLLEYVQGSATVVIDQPSSNTNLGMYAAGSIQNPGFFAGQAKQGGNGLADIERVILIGDPTNAAGYSNMGGIRMGGVVFSADNGVVGIRGENVAVQSIVAIGDIDARGSAVPTLMFNSNSQFQTVIVRGGDLRQSNGTSFDTFGLGNGGAPGGSPGSATNLTLGGFSFFNSTDGATSAGKKLWATPVNQSAIRLATVDQQTIMSGDWIYDWKNPQAVVVTQNGFDVSAAFGGDWLAKGGMQVSLDYAFERRTFSGALTLTADLAAGLELNLADARSNVTFERNLYGRFAVDGFGASIDGTLTIKGNLDGSVLVSGLDRTGGRDGQQNVLNALVVEGRTGPFTDVRAEEIGRVTIRQNFSGIVSTDVDRNNEWTLSTRLTGTGFADVEGQIGPVSIGYDANGKSTGGSIVNGTIQGMSGIGNIQVGGDVYGTPVSLAFFATASNSNTVSADVRNYGTANIGKISIRGDVDLDTPNTELIRMGGASRVGNGTFGDITILGLQTIDKIPGQQTGTRTEIVPGSESFVRILSPFTDRGFKLDLSTGQKFVQNFDPDGVSGPLDDTYIVTDADVAAGAKIYDLASKIMVAAKRGDRVPALAGGIPLVDSFANVLYAQNTALFEGKTRVVPVFSPDTFNTVSGSRGSLDGVYNNFGRINITGVLGAQRESTGSIVWTDSVDMNFGGITVGSALPSSKDGSPIGVPSTLGTISINNVSGAKANLVVSGVIGSPNRSVSGTNADTVFVGLAGIAIAGFEDVYFSSISAVAAQNNIIHATHVGSGLAITTVGGVGVGQGPNTVSPSIRFDSRILLDDGSSESLQTSLLSLNTGMINSSIVFGSGAGIVIDDGSTTGTGSEIGPLVLRADYVTFDGVLIAGKVGAISIEGGKGIGSTNNTAVNFTGRIITKSLGVVTVSASVGDVIFDPRFG